MEVGRSECGVARTGVKSSDCKKSDGLFASFLPSTNNIAMSYAGKDPRSRRTAASTGAASTSSRARRTEPGERLLDRELSITARGVGHSTRPAASEEPDLDWQHIALFTAGALLGAAVGAGAALLFAPQSGARTRHNLARRGRHLGTRTADAWDDLRYELRHAARRGRRKVSRALRDRRERRELLDELPLDD